MLKTISLRQKQPSAFTKIFTSLFQVLPRELESHPDHVGVEAEEYNRMVKVHYWLLNRPFIQMVSKLVSCNQKVLDIGTGPGWNSIGLAKRHPEWKITAIDLSPDMIAIAKKNAAAEGVSDQINFIVGDATKLPFKDNEFGLVISHFMLHHIDHPEDLLVEANRVRHQQGQVFIKDLLRQPNWKKGFLLWFSKYFLRYNDEQLREYDESMGAGLTLNEVPNKLEKAKIRGSQIKKFRGLDFILHLN